MNIFDFSLVDNTDVMELLEGKLGLITQLNEECMKKGVGGDENFVYKVSIRSFPPFFQSRNKNENELHLNLDGNTAGIYMIEVRTTNGRTVKKIILN